jgi:hypothetical protein
VVTHIVICYYKFNHVTVGFPAIKGIFKFTRIDYLTFLRGVIKAYPLKVALLMKATEPHYVTLCFNKERNSTKI